MSQTRNLLAALAFTTAAIVAQPTLAKGVINTLGRTDNVAISGLDTVGFFTDHKALKGDPKYSYEWKGAKWLFASDAHRKLFAADPEKYAPQWGGYCAVGIANGHVSKHVVAGSYDIHDGKLYLFAETRNGDFDQYRKEWLDLNGGPQSRVPTGDKLWSTSLKSVAEKEF